MEEIIEVLRLPTERDERLTEASAGDAHHAQGVARMLGVAGA
jgi:hypothetical protein